MPPLILGNVLQPLIDLTEAVLKFFHDEVGFSWGLSIIALTVCVRAVLVPLTVKQLKSMREMQRIAPEMKALQAKYKDDKPRLQQEMMALYKEHQVNPFGSCLPLLAQLPVFIALFYMLQKDLRVEICGQSAKPCGTPAAEFLFIDDITAKATGATLVALLILYIGSQLLSTIFMTATVDKTQRMLMLGLPFVFTIFVINFPAGLLVYWITTNFWTVGQGIIVRRTMPPLTEPDKGGGGKRPEPAASAAVVPVRKKRGRAAAKEPTPAEPAGEVGETPVPKPRSGPPPSARRKKKRAGRRR